MQKLSPQARFLLIELGNNMLNKQRGRSSKARNSEQECFDLAYTWYKECQENGSTLRKIAKLAEQAEKELPYNFVTASEHFLEQIATNPDIMHFLENNEGARKSGFATMLATSALVGVEAFSNTCRVLQELAR